jgi:hypothetical protein
VTLLFLTLQAQVREMTAMTATAIGFMLAVWGVIIWGTGYCFYRLLTSERRLDGGDDE